jgi:hypothetical protein
MLEKLKFITSSAWHFLRPLIAIFLTQVGPILAQAATAAVADQAGRAVAGYEKRAGAYTDIERQLLTAGIAVGTDVTSSMINAAIEAAVLKLKAGG